MEKYKFLKTDRTYIETEIDKEIVESINLGLGNLNKEKYFYSPPMLNENDVISIGIIERLEDGTDKLNCIIKLESKDEEDEEDYGYDHYWFRKGYEVGEEVQMRESCHFEEFDIIK